MPASQPTSPIDGPKTNHRRVRYKFEKESLNPSTRPRKRSPPPPRFSPDVARSPEHGDPGPSTRANRSRRSLGTSSNSSSSPKSPVPSRYRPHAQRDSPSPAMRSTPAESSGGQPSPKSSSSTQYWSSQAEGSNARVGGHASPKGKGKALEPIAPVNEQDSDASGYSVKAGPSRNRGDREGFIENDETVPLMHVDSAQETISPTSEDNPRGSTATTANGDGPATPPIDKPATPPIEKPATPPIEQPATPPIEKPATSPIDKPATPPIDEPPAISDSSEENEVQSTEPFPRLSLDVNEVDRLLEAVVVEDAAAAAAAGLVPLPHSTPPRSDDDSYDSSDDYDSYDSHESSVFGGIVHPDVGRRYSTGTLYMIDYAPFDGRRFPRSRSDC